MQCCDQVPRWFSWLQDLQASHLTIECTTPEQVRALCLQPPAHYSRQRCQADELSSLRALRTDFEIGFGCVSCEPGAIDSVETIVERVRALVEEAGVDPSRVTLNPDCGFAPGMGAVVEPDEVYQKLKHQSEAARVLRREYS